MTWSGCRRVLPTSLFDARSGTWPRQARPLRSAEAAAARTSAANQGPARTKDGRRPGRADWRGAAASVTVQPQVQVVPRPEYRWPVAGPKSGRIRSTTGGPSAQPRGASAVMVAGGAELGVDDVRHAGKKLGTRRDDLRGLHDVHRPDDRLHSRPEHPARARPQLDGRPVGCQRLPDRPRGAVRARWATLRHLRPHEDVRDRRHHLRRRVDHVRPDAHGIGRRGVDRRLPRPSGSRRRADVPGRPRHRRQHVPAARAGQGARAVLRHRRRSDRGRADPGRVPHPVDMARHLLGEHPGGAHRPGPHRGVEAQDAVQARSHRLPGRRADRRRYRVDHLRPAAIGPVELEQSLDVDLHRRGPGDHRCVRLGRAPDGRLPSFRSRSSASAPSRSRTSC